MENSSTCVPVETGQRRDSAPATFTLAIEIDGSWEPNAEAERYTVPRILVCSIWFLRSFSQADAVTYKKKNVSSSVLPLISYNMEHRLTSTENKCQPTYIYHYPSQGLNNHMVRSESSWITFPIYQYGQIWNMLSSRTSKNLLNGFATLLVKMDHVRPILITWKSNCEYQRRVLKIVLTVPLPQYRT